MEAEKTHQGGGSWNGGKGEQLELEERQREMEECVQKERCTELKFQKWNSPEIQDMVMEVD